MIVFNKNGNVISNTNYTGMAPDIKASYETYPWKEEVSEKGGKDIILGLHEDDWACEKADGDFGCQRNTGNGHGICGGTAE